VNPLRPSHAPLRRLTTATGRLGLPVLVFVLATALRCPEGASSDAGDHASVPGDPGDAGNGVATPSLELGAQGKDTLPRDSVADLPRDSVDARYVAPTGQTIRVSAGGNLQSALNRARPGDVVALAPGATYVGNFVLPAKRCGTPWITVRTDVPDASLPPEGRRMTPAQAAQLAKIATRNNVAALKTTNPTCGWRLMGLEITAQASFTELNYGIVWLGDGGWRDGDETQTAPDKVPADIVLDRVYLHGQATTNSTRCLALNSARSAVVSSWISDCHAKGFDSQAIAGWNGPGPYRIENNFLQGAGENVMFGGADPGIANLIPSDIIFRRNHVQKDPTWKGKWTVKNLFELKNARRVLIEANVFENNWSDAQSGMAIVIKSQSGNESGRLMWQGTTDVTFRYNHVRNSPRAFNLQAVGEGGSDRRVARVRAEHNLFEHIGTFNGTGQDGWMVLLTHDLRDIKIAHNTFVHNVKDFGTAFMLAYADGGTARNLTITDNILTSPAGYGIFYSERKVGIESLNAMAGNSWTFKRNVIAGIEPQFAAWHPPGNWYPPTVAAIGFIDPPTGEYRLSAKSDYKGRGERGKDPGADLARVRKETAGVVVR
jgi:hypothetical protein